MKLHVLHAIGLAGTLVVSGCQWRQSPAEGEAARRARVAAVESTLVAFSHALAAADSAQLSALVGDSFRLLDEGRTYDLPQLLASIRPVAAMGTMVRDPAGFHTEVRGAVAWSDYRVGGRYENLELTIVLDLLETAVLEEQAGRWRVMRMATLPATAAARH